MKKIIITCEHGGNRIPDEYISLFSGYENLLTTHKAYDPGALELSQKFAGTLTVSCYSSTFSRLLVDLNRSLKRRSIFSEVTRGLSRNEKEKILDKYYYSYRKRLENEIVYHVNCDDEVIHISVHSFTPVLKDVERKADTAFLYDNSRKREKEFCCLWKSSLMRMDSGLKIRFNYPYSGKPEGLTAYFRKRLPEDCYIGIELEVNQKHVYGNQTRWSNLQDSIVGSFQDAMKI
ncbi:MAG: N-formylglutamate amidohydrolase [Calditrichaceae bacterium]